MSEIYDEKFYENQASDSFNSAEIILKEFNQFYSPKSVIDVGCGVGTWLKAWQNLKSDIKIMGIDGNSVDSSHFMIDKANYLKLDLCAPYDEIINNIANGGGF